MFDDFSQLEIIGSVQCVNDFESSKVDIDLEVSTCRDILSSLREEGNFNPRESTQRSDRSWTDPEETSVSYSSIATYLFWSVGIRSYSIFDGFNISLSSTIKNHHQQQKYYSSSFADLHFPCYRRLSCLGGCLLNLFFCWLPKCFPRESHGQKTNHPTNKYSNAPNLSTNPRYIFA